MFVRQGEISKWEEELGSKVLQECWEGVSGSHGKSTKSFLRLVLEVERL